MGRKKFKYSGDAAFKAFLRRYDCPTPFHVVRMRFVGWVASPALASSPLPIIETMWPGGLPEFGGEREATTFYETFAGLINHVSRYQNGIRVAMAKLPKLRDREGLAAAFRFRAEEIRDGFLVGYHGDEDETQAPEQLREPLARLKSLVEELGDLADRAGREMLGDHKPLFAQYDRLFGVITGVAELQLTNLILSATAERAAELTGDPWGGEAK